MTMFVRRISQVNKQLLMWRFWHYLADSCQSSSCCCLSPVHGFFKIPVYCQAAISLTVPPIQKVRSKLKIADWRSNRMTGFKIFADSGRPATCIVTQFSVESGAIVDAYGSLNGLIKAWDNKLFSTSICLRSYYLMYE